MPGNSEICSAGSKLSFLLLVGFCLQPPAITAQTYSVLHCFGTNAGGAYPAANLVRGEDGALYGTTRSGGSFNQGTVFKLKGTNFTVLKEFRGSDGSGPRAAVSLSGTTLYGTAFMGGSNSSGTVFKLNTDGSGFAVLRHFESSSSDGRYPAAGVAWSGTTLYGTTQYGGANGRGTVFRINSDGSGYGVLHSFNLSDGAGPQGDLLISGATLYGTAFSGGTNGAGTVFRMNLDGTDFALLTEFTGGTTAGSPQAGLALSGDVLYGTAFNVFCVNTNGSGFALLTHYDWGWGEAGYLNGGVVLSGGSLYGSAANLFRMNLNGSGYTVLTNLGRTEGTFGLVLAGDVFYGTTSGGGSAGFGKVFSVKLDGSGYNVAHRFSGGDGYQAQPGLARSDQTFYGTTAQGGALACGTVYALNEDGGGYRILKDFSSGDARWPDGGLAVAGPVIYGTLTASSGTCGSVFRMNADGSGYKVLTNTCDGGYGQGLLLDGPNLYGCMGWGAAYSYGTVFKLNTNGGGYAVIKSFGGSDGANPVGTLVLADGVLYGATQRGGNRNAGTVFKLGANGNGFAVLKHFDQVVMPGDPVNSPGSPKGGLALAGKTLYGVTQGYGYGNVYKVNTDATGFGILKAFDNYYGEGAYPDGWVVVSGSTLYGVLQEGGSYGYGTVFRMNLDGGGFTVLKHFTGSDGKGGTPGILLSGMTLFGTTYAGGSANGGVVFSLLLPPVNPGFASFPPSQTVELGAALVFRAVVTGFPPPTYQWFLDGNPLVGATDVTLPLPSPQFGQSGSYTLVASNAGGAFTSASAMLSVIEPVERRPAAGVNVAADIGAFLAVEGSSSPGPPTLWETLGTLKMSSTSQYYFDVATPAPPMRFYRARRLDAGGGAPRLDLRMVTAVTITGTPGNSVRVDSISAIGPTNDWTTLDTVTLTNASQLYFDTLPQTQVPRLYRLVVLP